MSNIVIDIAAEFKGKPAFKQAETSTDKLTKSTKKLAKGLLAVYSTQKLMAYAKNSVKAAAADQKAQLQLANALKNVGMSRDAAGAEDYIQQLQKEFGVLDDELRPAYQTLAIATKDAATTQKILGVALDVSAATGRDLSSVTAALSKAYLGNNTALSKLGVGISKADLKTKSFEEIVDQLGTTFAGSAKKSADSFQGSINKLAVASNNASEIIGTGLIDALKNLGDDDSVSNLADDMEAVALYIADAIRGVGLLTKALSDLPGAGQAFSVFKEFQKFTPLGALAWAGKNQRQAQGQSPAAKSLADFLKFKNESRKDIPFKDDKIARENLKINKENLKLAKAKAIFDMQKIQIEAALKGKISEEDRIRLLLMQAIEDENITQIEKYQKLLDAAQKSTQTLVTTLQGIKPLDDIFKNWSMLGIKEQLASLETYFSKFAGSAASAFNSLSQIQQAALGGYKPFVGANIPTVASPTSTPSVVGMGTSGTGSQLPAGVTINNNITAGVGDPNAIAEAIDQVLTDAINRGTLRGFAIA